MITSNENKIAFVVPYFGKLPDYAFHFFQSLVNQPFDVLFFSDAEKPTNLPENVFWHYATLLQLKKRFSLKMGFPIALDNAYKLCDLKPAIGYLFSEFLTSYQFWGSIDVDMIVGNFENFFDDDRLSQIDFYSGRKYYVSGAFFLVRNTKVFNELFMRSRDWQMVFTNSEHFAFDECGGHFYVALQNGSCIMNLPTNCQSFTEVIILEQKNGLRTLFKDEILEPKGFKSVVVDTNRLCYAGKEFLCLHFIYFKANRKFAVNVKRLAAPYFVNSWGFSKWFPMFIFFVFHFNFWRGLYDKGLRFFFRVTRQIRRLYSTMLCSVV